MFDNPSLITRIAIGKAIGFAIGVMIWFLLPALWPDVGWMERLGFLFWYATVGAFIGFAGVFTWHPVLRLPMPWWVRSSMIGAWMNLLLTLFIHDRLAQLMLGIFGSDGLFLSPFWFVLEGALVGLLIGYFATRFGGEGAATVQDQP